MNRQKKKNAPPKIFFVGFFLLISSILLVYFLTKSFLKTKEKEQNVSTNKNGPLESDKPKPEELSINSEKIKAWWLTDEEIDYAYKEIKKEINNFPEIQLVSPSVARVIQEGGEISEVLKKAEIIFLPINNSETHQASDSGSHWTLLVYSKNPGLFWHYNSFGSSASLNTKKVVFQLGSKLGEKALAPISVVGIPQQTNGSDCGSYVIAFTRVLLKSFKKNGWFSSNIKEENFVFTIEEERKKLMKAGFPKRGTAGGNYEVGNDVVYLESEENLILEWWKEPQTPIQKFIKEELNLFNIAEELHELSVKVRRLSVKI